MRAAVLVLIVVACRSSQTVNPGSESVPALGREAASALNPHLGRLQGCLDDTTRTPSAGASGGSPARSITNGIWPLYPRGLRDRGTQGGVVTCFVVSEAGRVESEHIVVARESHADFTESVRGFLLRSARFEPATVGGVPVRSWVKQAFEFQLGGPSPSYVFDLRPPPGELADSVYLVGFVRSVARVFQPTAPYPERAVELQFTVTADRAIGDIRVLSSSGLPRFDETAVRALQRADLPARPEADRERPIRFTLSILPAASCPISFRTTVTGFRREPCPPPLEAAPG